MGNGNEERIVLDRRSVEFVMGTRKVIEDRSLKASDKSLYMALCFYADNKTSECFPSRKTLWETAGISDKTFRKSLDTLKDKGYIDVVNRYRKDGGRMSNTYILLDVK